MKSILILFNVIMLVTNNFAQTIKYSNEDNRVELKKTFIQIVGSTSSKNY